MNTELNTKLSTPTPQTDAAQFIQHDMTAVVSADFARTLERELATERARLDYLQEWGFDFLTRAAIDAAMKGGAK
jgi:hypothetical protein